MNYTLLVGIMGSLVLVTGAAWPEERKKTAIKSIKNWLFAIGGLLMLLYALLGYQENGQIFFVILEILVVIASIMMMMDLPDKIDIPVITVSGIALIIWSLKIFTGYNTIIFILGLCGIGFGYTLKIGSIQRDLALTTGSLLIALFSFIEASWLFFGLNTFFAIFAGYYAYKKIRQK